MKMPKSPPASSDLFRNLKGTDKAERLMEIMTKTSCPLTADSYWHWDDIYYRSPPEGFSRNEWWLGLKFQRRPLYKSIPLLDKTGSPFNYLIADIISEDLHAIDLGLGGTMQLPDPVLNPDTRDQYCINSLIEEAITSSQLEGASTTREVAKEMIRAGRPPRDTSERMILNNYQTMQRIRELRDEPLTREMVLEIHRLVSEQTLEKPDAAGRFRRTGEERVVGNDEGDVFHVPPPAEELEQRLAAMCEFANAKSPQGFVHPVIRSIILHFWLAYDHPFVDGNGRTARALFYWSMLHHRYWLCEFISISHIIRKAPVKYGHAFLLTETDENDLTYFVIYHLKVIRQAMEELRNYIQRKTSQIKSLEAKLRGLQELNHRQQALIAHALRHPNRHYSIESHRSSHNIVYQTARTDLLDLEKRGLLKMGKRGLALYFTAPPDLEKRLTKG